MKLNIKGCRSFCKRHAIKDYAELAQVLELSIPVVRLLEQRIGIGYDAVKNIYNKLGVVAVLQMIDFEGEQLNGFKSKYVQVGNKLY